jgi:hypothetical protein
MKISLIERIMKIMLSFLFNALAIASKQLGKPHRRYLSIQESL